MSSAAIRTVIAAVGLFWATALVAQPCLEANEDRLTAAAFVTDFAVLSPSVIDYICTVPAGGLSAAWGDLEEVMISSDQIFWVDWKDSVPGLMDEDYLYGSLQAFLQRRGVDPLRSWEREAVLNAVNPDWRSDYYAGFDLEGEQRGYRLLRSILRNRDRELMIYGIGADGWGLLIGPREAGRDWASQPVGYATIYTVEGFVGSAF